MNKRIPIIIGFILVILAVWLQLTSLEFVRQLILRLDNVAYDMQLRTKLFTHTSQLQTDIAIIDIDDKSLAEIGRWPWPRADLAKLINRLQEEGVVVTAIDMMFPEKQIDIANSIQTMLDDKHLNTETITHVLNEIRPDLDDDKKLADSFQNKDIVLGMTFLPRTQITGVLPPALITLTKPEEKQLGFIDAVGYISNITNLQLAAKNAGFINVFADSDGIIRRVPLLMRYQNAVYPSLALEAVRLFLLGNIKIESAEYRDVLRLETVKIGDHAIPVDANGNLLVSFIGKSFTFPYYSAADVLHKKIPKNALAGKMVFLGTSATGLGDLRATAVQGVFPGVEIQATIADNILKNHYSHKPAWTEGAQIFITFALGLCLMFIFPYLGPRLLSVMSITVPVILILANNWLWEKTGLIIFVFVPILLTLVLAAMNMIYGYLFETRKREHLKEMFGQYVPEKHIDEMLKSSGNYGFLGEDREMTILFADIRNFTSISEPMTASELKELLNAFFTPMTEIIFSYNGTIDKYIGDLIMAFWGAPLKDKMHAHNAIQAALDMQTRVDLLKPVFKEKGWAEVNIGIGINTGVMSVGDMGSQFRRNYTVLGDAVNLGSRVESLTKHYGVKIIATEATQKNQTTFLFRQLDRVKVKGKRVAVTIFEVIGVRATLPEETKHEIQRSELAIQHYFNQDWLEAEKRFDDLHTEYPHVKLYSLYRERIQEFKTTPPPADWDGVFTHLSK